MATITLKPRRRNIRTLPANRMRYLLENYPADCLSLADDALYPCDLWKEETVIKAMQAAYNAGRRDEKERQGE